MGNAFWRVFSSLLPLRWGYTDCQIVCKCGSLEARRRPDEHTIWKFRFNLLLCQTIQQSKSLQYCPLPGRCKKLGIGLNIQPNFTRIESECFAFDYLLRRLFHLMLNRTATRSNRNFLLPAYILFFAQRVWLSMTEAIVILWGFLSFPRWVRFWSSTFLRLHAVCQNIAWWTWRRHPLDARYEVGCCLFLKKCRCTKPDLANEESNESHKKVWISDGLPWRRGCARYGEVEKCFGYLHASLRKTRIIAAQSRVKKVCKFD